MKNIDKGTRFTNYLIDFLLIRLCSTAIVLLLGLYHLEIFIFYVSLFIYYLVFESINGRTLGKMVTKTKVVNKDGTRPKFGRILFRSLLRLIPIDAMSYMFGYELGFHDAISSTKLTKI